MIARILTIGTEITGGEVINSNAAYVATQLEQLGVRVLSHLSVRDHQVEILVGFRSLGDADLVVVTGGLGPTSDDLTRACMAEAAGVELEFDDHVWTQLNARYSARGLPIREAHRLQCFFPNGCERLTNPVGSALGFKMKISSQTVFVLPGPPRELEGMWTQSVLPLLQPILPEVVDHWVHWTVKETPESEVAEKIEPVVQPLGLEVGYRASWPLVRLKIRLNLKLQEHQRVKAQVDMLLGPNLLRD